jgi:hypothetical protein
VVVAPIDNGDVDRQVSQTHRSVNAGKSAAHDHHPRAGEDFSIQRLGRTAQSVGTSLSMMLDRDQR